MAGPVFLVGMMASGKTTVGRRLAALLDAAFCDLDERIERITGWTIDALFERGEPGFRAIEGAALRSLVAEPGFAGGACVVATGGGTVIDPANRAVMRRMGTVVLLEVPTAELVRRLGASAASRPLLRGGDPEAILTALWTAREAAYRDDAITIAAAVEPAVVATRILERLGQGVPP